MAKIDNASYEKPLELLKNQESLIKAFKKVAIIRIVMICLIIVGSILFIVGLAAQVFEEISIGGSSSETTILLVTIAGGAIALGGLLEFLARKVRKKEIHSIFREMDWVNIYTSVLESFYDEKKFKITGLELNNFEWQKKDGNYRDQTNKLLIEYNSANVEFDIITKIKKTVTKSSYSSKSTKVKYETFFTEILSAKRNDLTFSEPFKLVPSSTKVKDGYVTESVAFNEAFKIDTTNKMMAAKTFSPKIIDKYSQIKKNKKFEFVNFNEKGMTSIRSWKIDKKETNYEIAHFKMYFNINKSLTKMVNEMKEDLDKLYKNLVYIEPFL